ncbi:MAG: hypothetical protein KZQ99_04545 [Candidatus Thiodiazotropha sp. (ex Dulcina madagascariensis)]|nr:hypothetical protein [Candidatus Thiodiazotropha sp. (ex Dulcina madagascariensis)]
MIHRSLMTFIMLLCTVISGPLFADYLEIGCGASLTGPFDLFTDSVPNQGGLAAPTQFVTESAPPGLAGCVAFSVDTNGVVSAPSNVGAVTYLSPIEAIQDLGQRCYGTCSGTVNFSFTISSP